MLQVSIPKSLYVQQVPTKELKSKIPPITHNIIEYVEVPRMYGTGNRNSDIMNLRILSDLF